MRQRDPALHTGHRQRMRRQFRENGLTQFSEHQIMEMALFYVMPRGDTNELAHTILNECGPRICDVLDCSYGRLVSVKGVGENVATFLKFLREFSSYYLSSSQLSDGKYFTNEIESICKYFEGIYLGAENESIYAAAVTPDMQLIKAKKLADGVIGEVRFPVRKLMEFVCEFNCDMVVIAHNHPRGAALASKEDIYITREVVQIFRQLDVEITDHIIVGREGSLSMRSSLTGRSIWAQ